MGWLNFLSSTGITLGLLATLKEFKDVGNQTVKELHLLDNGKYIQITTFSLFDNKNLVKISEIINPEESTVTKLKMQSTGTWLIETTKGECFYMLPNSTAIHADVLKEILKGKEIDTSDFQDTNSDKFIDI